ncbi:hypothetical protein [Nitrosomonas sp. Nm33]|uniref:hypothetical protein n=1 Tax=Nitrosomonas sp. Nm33 TaxID=133724 RepID=UPI00089B40BF|nr:hypothetical protein [Nitrosomonas sp. Nm33]SDY41098.1 hypothetical protein SAMN05421755_10217 [Nitrosomonas sp. Nm33]
MICNTICNTVYTFTYLILMREKISSGHDDLSTSSDKRFTFTIENGAVTAFLEVENGVTEQPGQISWNDVTVLS